MKRALGLVFLLSASIAFAQSQYVQLTGSNITDAAGNKLQSGTITFTPVSSAGAPVAPHLTLGGRAVPATVTFSVVNGAIQAAFGTTQLADVSQAFPQNFCYADTIHDNNTGDTWSPDTCVQPAFNANWCSVSSGQTTCNFDNFLPMGTPGTMVAAPSLKGGTFQTGAAGSPVSCSVDLAGAAPSYALSCTIPQGIQGIQGIPALLGQGKGAYSATTTYNAGEVVAYNGQSYASFVSSNLGNQPDISPTKWGMLANLSNLPTAFASQSQAAPDAGYFSTVAASATNLVVNPALQAGATADVQIAAALTKGSVVDLRGYGATTQTIASTVTVGSSGPQTLECDPATVFQPGSATMTMFVLMKGAHLHNCHIDVTNRSGFSGQVVLMDDNYRDGDNTQIDGLQIYASGNTTGYGLVMTSASSSQAIAFVSTKHVRCYGLLRCIYLSATGTGWINGNFFEDINASFSVVGLELNTSSGGVIQGNLFSQFSYQEGSATVTGVLADGNGTNTVQGNVFSNIAIWDTFSGTNPVTLAANAAQNYFVGRIDGTVSDSGTENQFFQSNGAFFQTALANQYAEAAKFRGPNNTVAGNSTMIDVGTGGGSYGSALFGFTYQADSSATNSGFVGLLNRPSIISWFGNGDVSVGSTSDPGVTFGVTGLMNANGAGTHKIYNSSAASSYSDVTSFYAPNNAVTGNCTELPVGADGGAYDASLFGYCYGPGSGSSVWMGLVTKPRLLNVFGTGDVAIGTTADNGYALEVNGNVKIDGTITGGFTATYWGMEGSYNAGSSWSFTQNKEVYSAFEIPTSLTANSVCFRPGTADNTATNYYSFALYNSTGTLVLSTGALHGSAFVPSTAMTCVALSTGGTIAAGRYYASFTTNCSTACGTVTVNTASFMLPLAIYAGAATSGGAPNSTITVPSDVFGNANGSPWFELHK